MALSFRYLRLYGYDILLGSIAAFYVFMAPYTKVEESFNVQAMHDILYHRHHFDKYDHLEFPGVVPRSFIGSLLVSILASPFVILGNLLQLPKIYSLYSVRLVLGFLVLSTLRSFQVQIQKKFGSQVEAFFVILTALQFHLLFYCTRPLPNVLAFALVNLAYGYWLGQRYYAALTSLVVATLIFRCDMLLLIAPLGLLLLLNGTISLRKAIASCAIASVLAIGLTSVVDSVLWRRFLWPELEVFWFNSVLNRSSEWGTHSFHWYFTSALPRCLLCAYPLILVGFILERRVRQYVIPVLAFVLLYSKLPHKELRFIIVSVPIFNLSAAVAASRIYNNRKKRYWRVAYISLLGLFLISLGCTAIMLFASHENYPSGHALKALHRLGHPLNNSEETWVHIDTFSAMNGISRFCEGPKPWRYCKEEGIPLSEFQQRNFTYLLSEHPWIDGYDCLLSIKGFSRIGCHIGFPPVLLLEKVPKVFIHGNHKNAEISSRAWPGC